MANIISKLQKIFKLQNTELSEQNNKPAPSSLSAHKEILTRPIKMSTMEEAPPHAKNQLNAGYGQSTGLQREHNEDALFTLSTMLAYNESSLPVGLYIVADGMGGHKHGEIASELAIRAMVEHVVKELYTPLFSLSPHQVDSSFQEILQYGILKANKAILAKTEDGGTTITVVLIVGKQMTIAHVGDSRVYSVSPGGRLEALTRDHSLVTRLVELGQISPEEAEAHPQRNVLYRALGQGETFEPELISSTLPLHGSLLICSDGLWNAVSDQRIGFIIASSPTPQNACQELVNEANRAGGPDNISVILIELPNQ